MSLICCCPDIFIQGVKGVVFAPLKFIAHNCHFRLTIFFSQKCVSHPVSFNSNSCFQMFAGQELKIICSVQPSGCIDAGSDILQYGPNGRVAFFVKTSGTFKHQMFQQVRGACISDCFISRADMIGNHKCYHGR